MSNEPKAKIGKGSFEAWLRLGLRELRSAFYPGSNVAQASEYGMWGNKTPGEVADERRPDERDFDEEPTHQSIIGERLNRPYERNEPGNEMELEMED